MNEIPSSFRDPSGFVFILNGIIYRQINKSYKENYDLLISSGLYDKLISLGYLVSHREVKLEKTPPEAYKIIQPEIIPLISYPYEWCFSMLKDAAILTLNVQKLALEHGMSLKDSSSFNIQFRQGKPVLIDTLSFEGYKEGRPWIAYKQFVEHFLTPLALMSFTDIRLSRLTALFLDGIPVDLAARLLPLRSRLKLSLLLHIFAHASSQKKASRKKLTDKDLQPNFSKQSFLSLLDNLEGATRSLKWSPKGTEWGDYYEENNNYNSRSMNQKAYLVKEFLESAGPKTVWDIGSNTGFFSKIAAGTGASVISFDIDMGALEKNYLETAKNQETNILPLFIDLTNPTPALGFANRERYSILERGPADTVLALALVHHLAIAKNVPLDYIASLFSGLCKYLIIEFIPKRDSQVEKLLMNREDIFSAYTQENFEKIFRKFFRIKKVCPIEKSKRTLYLMEK